LAIVQLAAPLLASPPPHLDGLETGRMRSASVLAAQAPFEGPLSTSERPVLRCIRWNGCADSEMKLPTSKTAMTARGGGGGGQNKGNVSAERKRRGVESAARGEHEEGGVEMAGALPGCSGRTTAASDLQGAVVREGTDGAGAESARSV
jgi:hypothetical protein